MRARVLALWLLGPSLAQAQQAGWGNVGEPEDPGFSWTQPMFGGFWMAWTPATMAVFVFIFGCIALMGFLEWRNPGGAPRYGVLGLDTTRGDRLFISLVGAAIICLAWLGIASTPLWGGLALSAGWAAFVFWKV